MLRARCRGWYLPRLGMRQGLGPLCRFLSSFR